METKPWHQHYDYFVPTSMRYPRVSVPELLARTANSRPDKAATYFYGTEISFRELRFLSLRMANALKDLGVSKGDRVGLHLPNCPQYVIAYFASLSLGAIVVSINPMYTGPELRQVIDLTGLNTLITSELTLPNVRFLQQQGTLPTIIVTAIKDFINGVPVSTAESLNLDPDWKHFSRLLDESTDARMPKVQIAPDDPAIIMSTSGTTGVPKGAVLSHANIVAAVHQCFVWTDTAIISSEQSTMLAVLPFFHIYGHIICLNFSVFAGQTLILLPRFELEEFFGTVARFPEISFFGAVPTMLNAVFSHPKAVELELDKRLKMVNSGGAPCPVELLEKIRDLGVSLNEGWGMTETTSLGISLTTYGPKKAGSIGIPLTDTAVKLVDIEDGVTEVAAGMPGEMVIKGPTVMAGYWNNPEETARHIRDGWFHTGDIAIQDEDGYFFIVDRKKDMIIASGFNIFPRDIDEVLYKHPKIAEAVSLGIPHGYRGETVKAFVVLKQDAVATEEEIIAFCKEHLAAYKVPKQVEFRTGLPKSAVGKILRKILRDEEIAHQVEN